MNLINTAMNSAGYTARVSTYVALQTTSYLVSTVKKVSSIVRDVSGITFAASTYTYLSGTSIRLPESLGKMMVAGYCALGGCQDLMGRREPWTPQDSSLLYIFVSATAICVLSDKVESFLNRISARVLPST